MSLNWSSIDLESKEKTGAEELEVVELLEEEREATCKSLPERSISARSACWIIKSSFLFI
jgi:hypothetical protein